MNSQAIASRVVTTRASALRPRMAAAHPPQPGTRSTRPRKRVGRGATDARARRPGTGPRTASTRFSSMGFKVTPAGANFPGDPAGALHADDRRVHADGGPARERLREMLFEGGHVPVPDREQLEAAAPELLPGLEVIAPVGPEAAALQPHDELAGRAREPAHPLPARPVFGHVLALVRIRSTARGRPRSRARASRRGGGRGARACLPPSWLTPPPAAVVGMCTLPRNGLLGVVAGRLHEARPNEPARDGLY